MKKNAKKHTIKSKKNQLIEGKDYEKLKNEMQKICRQITDSERNLIKFKNNIQLFFNTDQNKPLIKGIQER